MIEEINISDVFTEGVMNAKNDGIEEKDSLALAGLAYLVNVAALKLNEVIKAVNELMEEKKNE